jgi:hypothetical protein
MLSNMSKFFFLYIYSSHAWLSLPPNNSLAAGQSHGVPTQFHVQDKGVAATTPDLVNSPFPPPKFLP